MCLFRDTLLNGQIANYFSHFIAIICTCPHLTPNAFVSKEKKRASQAPRSKFIIWAWGHGVKSGQVPTAPEKGIGAQSSKPRKSQTDLIVYGCERASVSGEPISRKKWTAFFQNSSRSRSSTRNALEPSRERSKKSASEISTPSNLCSFLYSILQFRKREFSQIEDMQKRTQIQKPVWQHTGTSRSSQRETHALPHVAASWSRSCTSLLALVGEARCWWWFCVRCATAARLRGKLNLLRSGVWGEFNLRELVFTVFNSTEVIFR